jgi:hypothetical protein
MTLSQFRASFRSASPPAGLGPPLLALWHDARGDWDKAHKCVDQSSDPRGMWVHAYLHRKEGDASNARYWYFRAVRTPSTASLDEEWATIASALLEAGGDE